MSKLKRILKGTGLALGGLAVLALAGYAAISRSVNQRMEHRYSFAPERIDISSDSATLELGHHLVLIKGCNECHGDDMGGKQMTDDAMIGRIWSTNLTKGRGGLPEDYDVPDWMAALRDGVGQGERPLLLMPSHEYASLSETDLAALIAYLRQLPSVDREIPAPSVGPMAKLLTWAGKIPLLPVEMIPHGKPLTKPVDTSNDMALGKYLAASCNSCHRPDLKGGESLLPGGPPVPNITASGNPGRWTEAQFMHTLRTGNTPSGHVLKNEEMPWKMTAHYSDKELAAVYKYLRSLQ